MSSGVLVNLVNETVSESAREKSKQFYWNLVMYAVLLFFLYFYQSNRDLLTLFCKYIGLIGMNYFKYYATLCLIV